MKVFEPGQRQQMQVAPLPGFGHNHFETAAVELDQRPAIAVSFRRGDAVHPRVRFHCWLPWARVQKVTGIKVDLWCSESGAKYYLDCLDADGWGLRYFLGADQHSGWHTFTVDPYDICESWEACLGKRRPVEPLEPVALLVEDFRDQGLLRMGLGPIEVLGEEVQAVVRSGSPQFMLSRPSLAGTLEIAGLPLIANLGLCCAGPGSAPVPGRAPSITELKAVAHQTFAGKLMCSGRSLDFVIINDQVAPHIWELTYQLEFPAEMQLANLSVRGRLDFKNVLGLPVLVDDEQVARLDGVPQPDTLLAEPSDWEQLQLGDRPERMVRLTTKGEVVKSLRLYDLRLEQGYPAYLLEVLVGQEEVFQAGSKIEFSLTLDLNPV